MNSIFAKIILSMILLFLIYSCSGRETREEYWDDGSIQAIWTEIERRDGTYRKDGKSTGWHNNGQKKFEAFYKNGYLHGKITEWDVNGTIRTEREYQDGEKHGKSIFMDDYGQIKHEEIYQNGRLIEKIK